MGPLTALALSLMIWIGGITGYGMPTEMPTIHLQTPTQLACMVYGIPAQMCIPAIVGELATPIHAAYFIGSHDIVIRSDLEMNSPEFIAILVHELTHHSQVMFGTEDLDCPENDERYAYSMEILWLEEHGYDPWEIMEGFFDTTPEMLEEMSTCSKDR